MDFYSKKTVDTITWITTNSQEDKISYFIDKVKKMLENRKLTIVNP